MAQGKVSRFLVLRTRSRTAKCRHKGLDRVKAQFLMEVLACPGFLMCHHLVALQVAAQYALDVYLATVEKREIGYPPSSDEDDCDMPYGVAATSCLGSRAMSVKVPSRRFKWQGPSGTSRFPFATHP